MVEWVGNLPGTEVRSAKRVISTLKLANGDYLEQWHVSMSEWGAPSQPLTKKCLMQQHFQVLQW